MKFPAKTTQDFELAPEGNHVAICNAVVDIGVQPGSGQYPAPRHQVFIRFELSNEIIEYGKDGDKKQGPVTIGKTFTASMHEKAALRKFIESWFGKKFATDEQAADFDLQKLLGHKCLLNVTHYTRQDGKQGAGLQSAAPIPKGMNVADVKQHNKSMYFDLETSKPSDYDALPEWLRKKVDGRIEEQRPVERIPGSDDNFVPASPDEFDGDNFPY